MHLGEAAVVAKVARARVGAMMTEVAGNLAAVVASAADEVARLVAQGQQLGRVQALSMVEVAVGVLAAVAEMVSVAEVHAAHLSAVLERLDRARVGLRQRDIHTLILLVELIVGARGNRLLLAGNVDSGGRGAPSHCRVAVWLSFGLARHERGWGRLFGGRSTRGGRQAPEPVCHGGAADGRRRDRGLVNGRCHADRSKAQRHGGLGHRRNRLGAED